MYDILQRVSRTESSITYLEAHADDAKKKLDKISEDVSTAKATFNTLKWVFGGLCLGTWGLLSAFVIMWAKHHFGW